MDERQNQILFALREITEEVSAQSSLEKAVEVLVSRIRKALTLEFGSPRMIY